MPARREAISSSGIVPDEFANRGSPHAFGQAMGPRRPDQLARSHGRRVKASLQGQPLPVSVTEDGRAGRMREGKPAAEAMQITELQLREVVEMLRSMGARQIVLFGSMVDSPAAARDVDIAVEGIPLQRILEADVAVNELLGVPTDLVSREENPGFFDIVKDYGRTLYQAA
jgi:predicted nucleotidyltransferase